MKVYILVTRGKITQPKRFRWSANEAVCQTLLGLDGTRNRESVQDLLFAAFPSGTTEFSSMDAVLQGVKIAHEGQPMPTVTVINFVEMEFPTKPNFSRVQGSTPSFMGA